VRLEYQLGEILKERLESGAWEAGALFPSERELEERFGVSRTVVRGALDMLEDDGEIARVRGSGTFVAAPKVRIPVCGLLRALLDPPVAGLVVSVIAISRHLHDAKVAELLALDDDRSELCQVAATISVGEPVCLVDSYVALRDAPWLPVLARELKRGKTPPSERPRIRLGTAVSSIETSRLSGFTSSQLGARPGPPAIVASVIQHGIPPRSRRPRPIEFARLVYRGDRVRLETGPGAAPPPASAAST
jgi:DNA-binding GntR family transcriptional regulator